MATSTIRKNHQPARARQVEKSFRRMVGARNQEPRPQSLVYRGEWKGIGAVLVCDKCLAILGGRKVPDDKFDFVELECFVCSAPIGRAAQGKAA